MRFADILLLEPNPRRDRRFRVKTISLENSRRTHQHRYVPLTHEDVTTDRRVCRFLAVVAFGWENTVQGCSVPLYEHVREGSVGTCHLAILEMAYQEGRLKRYAFGPFLEPHAYRLCGVEDAPCRCQIHLEGLEWFLYNRTPSFDAIVERMQEAERRAQNNPSGKAASSDGSSDGREEGADVPLGDQDETAQTSGKQSTERSEAVEGESARYLHIYKACLIACYSRWRTPTPTPFPAPPCDAHQAP